MGWSFPWSSSGGKDPENTAADTKRRTKPPPKPEPDYGYSDAPQKRVRPVAWNESLNKTDWSEPRHWVPHVIVVSVAFSIWAFYRSYLRRFPGSGYIAPWYFRRRSLLGKVTSVGDGDGFHLFHTPGGRLAGWGWLRRVPSDRKTLKGKTVSQTLAQGHATMVCEADLSSCRFLYASPVSTRQRLRTLDDRLSPSREMRWTSSKPTSWAGGFVPTSTSGISTTVSWRRRMSGNRHPSCARMSAWSC